MRAKLGLSIVGAFIAAAEEVDKDKTTEAEAVDDTMDEDDDDTSGPTTALARQVLSIVPIAEK